MTRQRSPALLQRDRSALVVIDMQERLMPAIADADAVTRAAGILIEASRQLEVPVVVTEQYPKASAPPSMPSRAGFPTARQWSRR